MSLDIAECPLEAESPLVENYWSTPRPPTRHVYEDVCKSKTKTHGWAQPKCLPAWNQGTVNPRLSAATKEVSVC